ASSPAYASTSLFSVAVAHPVLHSFPTRRSSDLRGYFDFEPLFAQLEGAPLRLAAVDLRGYGRSDKTPRGYDLTTAASDMAGVIRSEEHTSELQSRFDLVCRLLLEKKNNTQATRP